MLSRLDWDSEFFGLNIGRIDWRNNQEPIVLSKEELLDYNLIYVFVHHGQLVPLNDAKLVDSKVIYRKKIIARTSMHQNVVAYTDSRPNEELYDLALQSGVYSRFRLDGNFPAGSYEKLYRRWIEQSVCKVMADDVLCYYDGGKILGMVTVDVKDNIGSIGLVAVDVTSRGKGVGSVLLSAVDAYFSDKGISSVEVATQLNNLTACSWYERNGYKVASVTDIYHLWIH